MQNNPLYKRTYMYLGMFMSILILCFGIILLATDLLGDVIVQPNRKWLAIVFLIYGVIRGARSFQQYRQFKSQNDE